MQPERRPTMTLEQFLLAHEKPDAPAIQLESRQPMRDLVPEPPDASELSAGLLIDATAAPEVFEPARTPREARQQRRRMTVLALRRVRVPRRLLSLFTQHLATLLGAGVGMAPALAALSTQREHPRFGYVISHMLDNVEQNGRPLSAAMAVFPRAFPRTYVAMVRVGESSGRLADALREAARLLDRDEQLSRRVRGVVAYPLTVFVIALALGFLMLAYVLPSFAHVFESQPEGMPRATQVLLESGRAFQSPGFLWGVGIRLIVLFAFARGYATTRGGRLVFDRLLLSLPVVGELSRRLAVARFSATLASLLSSGLRMVDAIEISGSVTGHEVFRAHARQAVLEVAEGKPLSDCLPPQLYGRFLANLVATAETTGGLDLACRQAAQFHEGEVEMALASFASLIEPLLVGLLGVGIAAMLLTVFVPLYGIICKL